jgi:hypothetical protein
MIEGNRLTQEQVAHAGQNPGSNPENDTRIVFAPSLVKTTRE